ncbi:MAG: aspartate kinase [Spirochaetales bacterium]|uniref:Aspartokinase n=1 Tax=Candidatus Thalassospirochaeta sargassi TaxID=3119039 RepID=A0AAJ1IF00_9SPIO|nr:aspartate kinase [Spirochaetales bacterium]
MKVMKFGGSSVMDAEKIRNVVSIIKTEAGKTDVAVVLSAMKGITDDLINCAKLAEKGDDDYKKALAGISKREKTTFIELIGSDNEKEAFESLESMLHDLGEILLGVKMVKECSTRSLDLISSFGERMNNTVAAAYMRSIGVDAEYVDARELVLTDSTYGAAKVNYKESYKRIKERIDSIKGIAMITGFIGANKEGVTTTLGRNGSDFTASIIAAATDSSVVEIWTDVDGVLSADPRCVNKAYVIPEISYQEAMELSYFGAEVIHPYTMIPAVDRDIPILIKNTLNPSAPGTIIARNIKGHDNPITGIASIKDVALINVEGSGMIGTPGIASKVFGALAESGINVIMISQASSEHSISFVFRKIQAERALDALNRELGGEVESKRIEKFVIREDLEIISAIGDNMVGTPGIAGRIFSALGDAGISILSIAQGSSERSVSFVIEKKHRDKALNTVHDAFLS